MAEKSNGQLPNRSAAPSTPANGRAVVEICWDELRTQLERAVPGDLRHLSQDLSAEAMARLFMAMESGVAVENPVAFGHGILRNVVLETRRRDRLWSDGGDRLDARADLSESPIVEETEPDELGLQRLKATAFSATERKLFDTYYQQGGDVQRRREKLAAKLGISMGTLYTRISRLKDRLRAAARRGQ
jgi:DNA-directed RNA polymerase specialized sigma24 family protein